LNLSAWTVEPRTVDVRDPRCVPGGLPTSSGAAATPLTPDTCAWSPRSRRPTPARESRSSFGTRLVHGLPGDFLQEWDDIGGTSTFKRLPARSCRRATACGHDVCDGGRYRRNGRAHVRRVCASTARRARAEVRRAPSAPRRSSEKSRVATRYRARQAQRCVGMALGGQPSRGRTVRTRMMKSPNASMKSRRNCSVVLSVTSPSSVISPGVNWM
jgi:hypothetical protein